MQIHGHFMLMNWKTQYHYDVNSSQTGQQIPCNPNQNLSKAFCRCQLNDFNFFVGKRNPRIAITILKQFFCKPKSDLKNVFKKRKKNALKIH